MFTGIIQELGTIRSITSTYIEIEAISILKELAVGDSVAVNGCCLTVVRCDEKSWAADIVEETLLRTCLRDLKVGAQVNLEAALRFSDRLGGHLVQGHVEGVGTIRNKKTNADGSILVTIESPSPLLRYIVEKGSIAVDGVSLTVTHVDSASFAFAMIPHTAKATTLGQKKSGDRVNLETDFIAKYLEKLATHTR